MSYENIQTRNGRSRREKGGSLCMSGGGGGEAVPRSDRGSVTRDGPKTYRLHNKMVNKIIFRHTASTIPGPDDNSGVQQYSRGCEHQLTVISSRRCV